MMASALPPESGYKTHIGFGRHANEDAGWAATRAT
jgi:hypothetical protein